MKSTDGSSEVDSARILPLVTNAGNRQVLTRWISEQDEYELAADESELSAGNIDCVIFDTQTLLSRGELLIERKERDELVLPYLLLVEESEEKQVRKKLRNAHPDLWEIVDGVIGIPIAEYRLDDRVETVLRMREQSREVVEQRSQIRAIRDEHAGHGVIITDPEGNIEYVNPAFEQQSGYEKEEVLGETPAILNSGEHDEALYERLWDTIRSGNVWQGELVNERKNGERYVVDQTIAPVTDPEGEIEKFIAVNHEITELKELEASLRQQREQLNVLNRVLRHDIRNDLTVFLGWAEALEDHVSEAGQEYLERMNHTGQHMLELTEGARDIVESIHSDEEPDLKPVDIGQTIVEEVKKRNETFEDAVIDLEARPPDDTRVWANEMLSSVFRNLINNAVQHNDAEIPTVHITAVDQGDSVVVEIADNGPGVPNEVKQTLFEDASKGLESEGTGMGLFLVHSLVETYGGNVWVEDNDPTGSVFLVKLPTVDSEKRGEDES
ncbi:MAG: nitrogen regulation protein NR(II) [Halodesulfurarchaeum sp.]